MSERRRARHRAILDLLADGNEYHIQELASQTGASLATLRRDLEFLDSTGMLVRTHGGARPREAAAFKPSYADRLSLLRPEKMAIVREALKLIRNQDTIALCNGTTTYYLAKAICQSGLEVTVITNAIDVALEMAVFPKIRSILIGGEISEGYALGGFWTDMVLKQAPRVDRVFLGADGISVEHGLTAYYPNDASTHAQMAALGREVVALVDHSKFGVVKLAPMIALSNVDLVIADSGLSEAEAADYRAHGVQLQIAKVNKNRDSASL